MLTSWGKHLILDLYRCKPQAITCPNNIIRFTDHLVRAIDMKAYGRPQVQHFGEGVKAGYTLVQLIETSNITGHFCDETGDAYLDVFSCKGYDARIVENLCIQYFMPTNVISRTLVRQAVDIPKMDYP
jgi:S-adenosylmethionine/arginine decarboxylase-like enzyme